jgi:hypothetical protein
VYARLTVLLLAGALTPIVASEAPAEEYRVKGAFLLNFAKFVEWPPQVFKKQGDPLVICILGLNPFTPALDLAAREITVDSRSAVIRQIPDARQAGQCQIVFVSVSEKKHVRAVLEAVQKENILTVGESEGFVASGGVIEFSVEESKVRMEISAEAARRAGLRISAKLLSLAQSGRK